MNNEIYAVTKGSYSDYHIITLTTSYEIAKKIKKRYDNEYGECNIERYVDGKVLQYYIHYIVYFNQEGHFINIVQDNDEYSFNDTEAALQKTRFGYLVRINGLMDTEKAKKIACDMIAEWRAINELAF